MGGRPDRRRPPRTLRRAVNVCRAHHKVAVLTSPGAGPAELALLLEGVHRTFVICEELGTAREQVTVVTSDKAADHVWRDPNVVIVIGGGPEPGAAGAWIAGQHPAHLQGVRGWALPAEAYRGAGGESGEGESPGLRAAQLARLGSPDRRPPLGHRLRQRGPGRGGRPLRRGGPGRRQRSGRLRPYRGGGAGLRGPAPGSGGPGPHALERLPEPDLVRIGGGGVPVVTAVTDRRPERIVTHASTRDEAEALGAALGANGYTVRCSLLQSVELDTAAWSERERSVVFLLSALRSDLAP